jgi:tRNA(fMet)-specific endonuclease VapC
MSLFVLDTDTLTLYQFAHAAVVRRVRAHPPADVAITVISVEEQLGGWYTKIRRAKKPADVARAYQRLTDNVQTLSGMKILSFIESAVRRRDDLKRAKVKVGNKDLAIAAIALENGATLVTRNRRDFERVPGLPIEDWSQ